MEGSVVTLVSLECEGYVSLSVSDEIIETQYDVTDIVEDFANYLVEESLVDTDDNDDKVKLIINVETETYLIEKDIDTDNITYAEACDLTEKDGTYLTSYTDSVNVTVEL